jgi:hypothetical protein
MANLVPATEPLQEGRQFRKEGKMNESAACYGNVIVMGNREAAYNKGNDMMRSIRFHEANDFYNSALKLYPEFADA